MKGIIFTTLGQMIEEKFGLEFWDKVILDASPASEGIYTAGNVYADQELFALVASASKLTGIPTNDLVAAYGEYLFDKLIALFPGLVPENYSLKQFLKSINNVIHVEVKKLHPNAELPSLSYEDTTPKQLVILYRSPRKLCPLAIGLMKGAANHYKEKLNIEEPVCMHQGADHCRFELTFSNKTD